MLASIPPHPAGSAAPPRTPATELAYTRKKIEANFSNFSAWHQRSKIFEVTKELEDAAVLDKGAGAAILNDHRSRILMGYYCAPLEFDFVNQAMYTMPSDQSGWMYHRWLISQSQSLQRHTSSDPSRSALTLIPFFIAKNPDVVTREIKVIQDLLDEEPDSKCTVSSLLHLCLHYAQCSFIRYLIQGAWKRSSSTHSSSIGFPPLPCPTSNQSSARFWRS